MGLFDAVTKGASNVYHSGRDAVRHAVDRGKDVVHDAVDSGSDAVEAGTDVVKDTVETGSNIVKGAVKSGSSVVKGAVDTGSSIVKGGVEAGRDVVELSSDAAGSLARGAGGVASDVGGAVREQGGNYAGGVYQWGRNQVSTAWDATTHPGQTARGLDSLARFNPVYGIPAAALEGKNPAEWVGDNYRYGTGVRDGFVEEYRNVRDEHGYAGVAGYIAPEAAIAIATGGAGTAGESAGRQAARVGVDTVTPGARDVYTRSGPAADDDRRWWEGGIDLIG